MKDYRVACSVVGLHNYQSWTIFTWLLLPIYALKGLRAYRWAGWGQYVNRENILKFRTEREKLKMRWERCRNGREK